ncbi:hypothetical protein NDU88_006555 [Pleurodeles waltl]|uniref:Uncharacterized protein n=1 Tax=Pleurodeles waltl TaxID=8319 RepID=A0AAV7QL34_PLEWA|nr:hypothetical protein NDU88_006555 [Pleurodeles waltl]
MRLTENGSVLGSTIERGVLSYMQDDDEFGNEEMCYLEVTGKEKEFDEYALDIEHDDKCSAEALDDEVTTSKAVVKNVQ